MRSSSGPAPGPPAPGPPAPPERVVAWTGATLAAAALVLFGVVAATVLRSDGRDRWDFAVQQDVLARGGRTGSALARVALDLTAPVVVALVAVAAVVVLWRWARRPLLAAGVLAVSVSTAALVQLLALALAGVRPSASVVLGLPVFDGTFPSVRTAAAEALWGALALAGLLVVRRGSGRALCVGTGALLSVAVAWGQLDVGRAWPTDVLGGWLLGVAAVGVAAALLATWPAPYASPPGPGTERERAADARSTTLGA